MVNFGLLADRKSLKSANVSFRIPYYTQWGQSLLVCGSEPILGSWNVKKGILLSPSHQGGELIWAGSLTVPSGFSCEYNYYVVDDERNVLRWEAGNKRKLMLPDEVQDGEVVELHDLWQASAFDPKEKVWTRFPSEGSKYTSPHQSCEFRWNDYCPLIFRTLREVIQGRCNKLHVINLWERDPYENSPL